MEHLNSLHGALAAIKHTAPPFYMNISAHGVGWWRQVYDSALHLGHHVYAVSYPLGSNAAILQTLQSRENIRTWSKLTPWHKLMVTSGCSNSTVIVIASTWKGKWSGPRAGAELIWTVPVSIASLIRIALLISLVKTHPWNRSCTHNQLKTLDNGNGTLLMGREGKKTCRPKLLALQWWMPSSTELILITGNMGPKGSSQAILMSGRTWSSSNGQMRLPSLLYSWQKVAPFSFASITRPSMKLAEDSVTTGVISQSSSGGPTFSFANLALTFSTTASAIDSMISTTFTAVHLWPLWSKYIWVQY